jgi:hypothetical protein
VAPIDPSRHSLEVKALRRRLALVNSLDLLRSFAIEIDALTHAAGRAMAGPDTAKMIDILLLIDVLVDVACQSWLTVDVYLLST